MKTHCCMMVLSLYCPLAMSQAQPSQSVADNTTTRYANNPWSYSSSQPLYRGDAVTNTPPTPPQGHNPWAQNQPSTPHYRPLQTDDKRDDRLTGFSPYTQKKPADQLPTYQPYSTENAPIEQTNSDYLTYRAQNWRPNPVPSSPLYARDSMPQPPLNELSYVRPSARNTQSLPPTVRHPTAYQNRMSWPHQPLSPWEYWPNYGAPPLVPHFNWSYTQPQDSSNPAVSRPYGFYPPATTRNHSTASESNHKVYYPTYPR